MKRTDTLSNGALRAQGGTIPPPDQRRSYT
jgi:hypothetical protein